MSTLRFFIIAILMIPTWMRAEELQIDEIEVEVEVEGVQVEEKSQSKIDRTLQQLKESYENAIDSVENEYHKKTVKYYTFDCDTVTEEAALLGTSKSTMKFLVTDDVWQFNCSEINGIQLEALDNDIDIVNIQFLDQNNELITDSEDQNLLDLRGSIVRNAQKTVSIAPVNASAIIITTKTNSLDGLEASYKLTVFTD